MLSDEEKNGKDGKECKIAVVDEKGNVSVCGGRIDFLFKIKQGSRQFPVFQCKKCGLLFGSKDI